MLTLTPETHRPRVLIADDEPVITRTLTLILRQNGFDAFCVLSGEAALHTARISPPDALIVDAYMRGISGIETALRVREIKPDCKTILISGAHPTPEILAELASLGEDAYFLVKPFTPEELLEKLRLPARPRSASEELNGGVLVSSL
jgi:two-component system KDP operon response regulator KdpE